jgi:cardiolipin synthase
MINFPTLITLARIVVIPFVMLFLYFDFWVGDYVAAILFSFACLSDYLDGYFARTLNQVSPMGTFLDPIADKLLICSTLFMLVAVGRIEGYSLIPSSIIFAREIFVSGLREYLASIKVSVPVSRLAKWKTFSQMAALLCTILSSTTFFGLDFEDLGSWLLWLCGLLTSITAYRYWSATVNHISRRS